MFPLLICGVMRKVMPMSRKSNVFETLTIPASGMRFTEVRKGALLTDHNLGLLVVGCYQVRRCQHLDVGISLEGPQQERDVEQLLFAAADVQADRVAQRPHQEAGGAQQRRRVGG